MTTDLIKKFEEESDAIIADLLRKKPRSNGTINGAVEWSEWLGEAVKTANDKLSKLLAELSDDGEVREQMKLIGVQKIKKLYL